MTNGGYVMVPADGLDISSTTAQTVNGLHSALTRALSTTKWVLLTGALYGELSLSPVPCACCAASDGDITIFCAEFVATVDSTDTVTPET